MCIYICIYIYIYIYIWIYLYRNIYYVRLTNHIELLRYLVIYVEKACIYLALILRFTLIDSYFKKISLCI